MTRAVVAIIVLALIASVPALSVANDEHTSVPKAYASVERVLDADETGVVRPAAIAWDAAEQRLLITDAARPGSPVAMSTTGAARGRATAEAARSLGQAGLRAARGLGLAAVGAEASTVAVDSVTGHHFAWSPESATVWEFDSDGAPVARRDLSDAGLHEVTSMAVAPSADGTDAPEEQALYMTDAGTADGGGAQIVEIALVEPTVDAQAILAAASSVQLVATINTGAGSAWTPDSPDPSGLAYIPAGGTVPAARQDRLVSADGEVDETTGAGFHGVNVWFAPRNGSAQTSTMDTTVAPTSPKNNEPVGAAYDTVRQELYLAKDGGNGRIWVYNMATGAQVRVFDVTGAPYNNADIEGIAFDSARNILYMVDAIDNDLVKVLPGAGPIGSGGEQVFNYDLQQYGQNEPEGLDVDVATGNVWLVSNKVSGGGTPEPMIEVSPTGALVSSVSIAAANPNSPGGLSMAPASNGSGATNIYVADRGVDNNDNPAENDGKIYEFATGAGTGQPPIANFDWAQGTGFLVNFDDTSSNNATTWDWDFGDPSTSSDTADDPSPSYTYPAAGTYQVTLTVTNSFGTDSTTQAVTVSDSPPPTADNLLTNGSFEIDADGDTRPDGWTEHIAFLRHTTVPPIDGTYVGRHASSGGHSYTVYANAPVVAGRVYSMSGHYLAATTSDSFTLQIKIKWRSAGGNISTVTIKKYTDDTAGAWTSFSGIVTAPSTATTARVMMQVKSLNTNFHVDDFVLQEAP